MLMDRDRAAELGQQTAQFLNQGNYTNAAGQVVEIGELVERAVDSTTTYSPEMEVEVPPRGDRSTTISVVNETTLGAARRFAKNGMKPVALNFASATSPGGGFLHGARAQEESLCRSSGLYACLRDHEMYEFHCLRDDTLYTDYVIYSPDVPVFRTDEGTLLLEPYVCSFITSAAVNARELRGPALSEVEDAMWARTLKVMAVAAKHDHETLILGAWGCGAFRCDSDMIANMFAKALHEQFPNVFGEVHFAITDWSEERRFIGPFLRALT